jgi:acyl carrier protein
MAPHTDNKEIDGQLTGIFRRLFDEPSLVLHDYMTAADVENWDSLNHVYLIVEVEKTFRIKFTLAEVQNLKNVGALIQLIAEKVQRS